MKTSKEISWNANHGRWITEQLEWRIEGRRLLIRIWTALSLSQRGNTLLQTNINHYSAPTEPILYCALCRWFTLRTSSTYDRIAENGFPRCQIQLLSDSYSLRYKPSLFLFSLPAIRDHALILHHRDSTRHATSAAWCYKCSQSIARWLAFMFNLRNCKRGIHWRVIFFNGFNSTTFPTLSFSVP